MTTIDVMLVRRARLPFKMPQYTHAVGQAYGKPVQVVTLVGYRARFEHNRVHLSPEAPGAGQPVLSFMADEVMQVGRSDGPTLLNPRLCRQCGQLSARLLANEGRDDHLTPIGLFRCEECSAEWRSTHSVPEVLPSQVAWEGYLAAQTVQQPLAFAGT